MKKQPVHRMQKISLRQRMGAALVMVLCTIVLVVVLALAFMTSVAIERQSAASYASETEVRMLAESAVNLVMAQIRQASEQTAVAWTSQPGLLRTFDANGSAREAFKLYSAATLKEDGAAFNPAADMPGDWTNRPAEFVDLNRPVVTPRSGSTQTNYPILDPRGVGTIDGLSISNSPYGAAMPVQWIYVLKDGTMTNSTGMTKENPAVARIAFWTDDETCKLNINTASEGAFWDIPKTSTPDDVRMALNQPAQREFQTYPGHPATTSLSPALYKYFTNVASMSLTNTPSGTTFPEELFKILPRTTPGGSRGGTAMISYTNGALPLKTDRLFSSVDEMVFLQATSAGAPRQANQYIRQNVIDQTRFVLTAHSRSPELNLFNMPRVTIWPVSSLTDELHRTPYDNLIAFASTVNSNAYYFTRSDSYSPTADFSDRNVKLYEYLQGLTARQIPGFGGGTFSTKYGADRDQILTEIFDYIRCVNLVDTSSGNTNFSTFTPNRFFDQNVAVGEGYKIQPAPGYGQVVPIAPPGGGPGAGTRGFGRFDTLSRAVFLMTAVTNVVSTNVPSTTNTILECALFLEPFSPSVGQTIYAPDYEIAISTPRAFTVASGETTNNVTFSGSTRINVHGTQVSASKSIGGYVGFSPGLDFFEHYSSGAIYGQYQWKKPVPVTSGGSRPYDFVSQEMTNVWTTNVNPMIGYHGGRVIAEIKVKDSPTDTSYNRTVQTIAFDFKSSAIPDTNSPVPPIDQVMVHMPMPEAKATYRDATTNVPLLGIRSRFAAMTLPHYELNGAITSPPNATASSFWIQQGDMARSVEATPIKGDLRLLAGKSDAQNDFDPMANSYSPTADARLVYSAMASAGDAMSIGGQMQDSITGNRGFGNILKNQQQDFRGVKKTLAGAGYVKADTFLPYNGLPPEINGVENYNNSRGDWDTGQGEYMNGPFINKADDGTAPQYGNTAKIPYIAYDFNPLSPGKTFSSPSRQIPSAVMFGSLPTGVKADHPWQTLLFCPNPASLYGPGSAPHPGAASPKDHLLLDLFHMPVVEPYAISEPFSTAGKVNMNYQIIPFTGIERKTALYGALKSVKVTAIDNFQMVLGANFYKGFYDRKNQLYRYPLDIPETLGAFDDRFQTNGVFRSASEICDIFMIPDPTKPGGQPFPSTAKVTRSTIASFWEDNPLTGDNVRENPYALLYPRLTTRSNTYTVHVWVETLKKIPSTSPNEWVEGRDKVTGEFRGSYLIERYLHPADPDIPDYATAANPRNLNTFYRFRVINAHHFNP